MPLFDSTPSARAGAKRRRGRATAPAAAITPEKRRGQRHRTLRGATIVYGDCLLTLDCTVHDRSGGGMMIELPPLSVMPDRFFLVEHRNVLASDVRVRWRQENKAGLEILAQTDVDSTTSAPLRVMRGIWIEKEPRSGLPAAVAAPHDYS